ncbi:MAG TPA: protein translocase subunit SecF [Chiayiivirga sp.]|nr:protein translocase subunit SecF [Xanthomonadaceae bacterium]MEB2316443.1 protein translocase subunit SecF [Xanthomonadaceae bacterium]HRN59441.1 protein translocase subunit SecF [Chiayiivirga sp.]
MNIFPYDSKIDFLRYRHVALVIAVLMIIGSMVLLGVRGLNYALDFTGGTVAELTFEHPADLDDLRDRLDAGGYPGAVVQAFGSEFDVMVRLQSSEGQDNITQTGDAVRTVLSSNENPATLVRSDFVGPQVGKELAQNGILAAIFVMLGFVIYISIRFEWKFAIAAILSTSFTLIITTALFAVTWREFDLTVMAGVLSVMGYAINDTIVVFDRVRENFRSLQKVDTREVLNRSVNQTLSRTVITSFVALLTVIALYIYGGDSLEGMAESQICGIIVGTLSSIFVACPLLLLLGTTKMDMMPKVRDDADLARRP